MTEQELQEIIQRRKASTCDKFDYTETGEENFYGLGKLPGGFLDGIGTVSDYDAQYFTRDNAMFILNAGKDIDKLVAEIERLKFELRRYLVG